MSAWLKQIVFDGILAMIPTAGALPEPGAEQ